MVIVTFFSCRVIFRAESDGKFAHLVQGGDPVTFSKSKEDQNSRTHERIHRLKMQGSFFKQGLNDAATDTSSSSSPPSPEH
ncbi:unnamed protein product [Oncorhynchus mykiss]|uniref:Uncharacterized protein n=1 Tax=Oncorhynchus mykiss TaxID=8022 RepID=A0A060YFM7_ONCMY|nr:unnamed protein product [Oncorhynchus mykiss]